MFALLVRVSSMTTSRATLNSHTPSNTKTSPPAATPTAVPESPTTISSRSASVSSVAASSKPGMYPLPILQINLPTTQLDRKCRLHILQTIHSLRILLLKSVKFLIPSPYKFTTSDFCEWKDRFQFNVFSGLASLTLVLIVFMLNLLLVMPMIKMINYIECIYLFSFTWNQISHSFTRATIGKKVSTGSWGKTRSLWRDRNDWQKGTWCTR